MDEETHCIVYGSESLCTIKKFSEPIKDVLFKIFNFNNELLDISKLLSHSEDVCAEIEQIGQTLVTLAGKIREKILREKYCEEQSSAQGKEKCALRNESATNVNTSDETNDCNVFDELKVSLIVERNKNEKLQSAVDELRLIQEERLTRLEEQVKKADRSINEKLKTKKLDRRKEHEQNTFKSAHVYNKRLQKNEKGPGRSPTPRTLALPQCESYATEKGYEHIRLGNPVPPRSLKEKKEELQLQEEIKWTRITPIPVHGRKGYPNSPLSQKKS